MKVKSNTLRIWKKDQPVYCMTVKDNHNFIIKSDKSNLLVENCAGWSIATILEEGVGKVKGKIDSGPPKHLNTAVQQIVNFLGILQNEWNGAQALNGFDTYLAPFIRKDNMTYDEIKQCMQFFLFSINVPSRWGCFDLETSIEVEGTIDIELEDGKILQFKETDLINTINRGKIFAKDLTEEDDIKI